MRLGQPDKRCSAAGIVEVTVVDAPLDSGMLEPVLQATAERLGRVDLPVFATELIDTGRQRPLHAGAQ